MQPEGPMRRYTARKQWFFFSSRRRHTRFSHDWSSDVCSSDLVVRHRLLDVNVLAGLAGPDRGQRVPMVGRGDADDVDLLVLEDPAQVGLAARLDALRLLMQIGRASCRERV